MSCSHGRVSAHAAGALQVSVSSSELNIVILGRGLTAFNVPIPRDFAAFRNVSTHNLNAATEKWSPSLRHRIPLECRSAPTADPNGIKQLLRRLERQGP